MNHDDVRTVLYGLSMNPTNDDRDEAIKTVMRNSEDPPKTREVTVPFPGRREVRLTVPVDRFTAEDWKYMLRVFEAMKPGLLTEEETQPDLTEMKAQHVAGSG